MKSSTILKYALVRRGHQNFLGGRLFSTLIQLTPSPMRRWAALRIVGLSPHYFYGPADREHNRLTTSRRGLISDLVAPLCSPESVALDYGCGPGYAAKAVSAKVRKSLIHNYSG